MQTSTACCLLLSVEAHALAFTKVNMYATIFWACDLFKLSIYHRMSLHQTSTTSIALSKRKTGCSPFWQSLKQR